MRADTEGVRRALIRRQAVQMIQPGGQCVTNCSITTHVSPPGRERSARWRHKTLASVNRTRAIRMNANLIPSGELACYNFVISTQVAGREDWDSGRKDGTREKEYLNAKDIDTRDGGDLPRSWRNRS